jgi:hypothetical protein
MAPSGPLAPAGGGGSVEAAETAEVPVGANVVVGASVVGADGVDAVEPVVSVGAGAAVVIDEAGASVGQVVMSPGSVVVEALPPEPGQVNES